MEQASNFFFHVLKNEISSRYNYYYDAKIILMTCRNHKRYRNPGRLTTGASIQPITNHKALRNLELSFLSWWYQYMNVATAAAAASRQKQIDHKTFMLGFYWKDSLWASDESFFLLHLKSILAQFFNRPSFHLW